MRGPTVADVGEHALIARLRARLPVAPAHVVVGIGDDAAAVEPPRGALEVLTTDTLVEGVHFDRRFSDPADVGHKALAVNVSDLAAMGATPRLFLLSVGLPGVLSVEAFDGMLEGLFEEAARQRVTLVGGNITRSPGPWFVDVTAIGTARRRRVLTRSGGRAGDELYVTGRLGAARAGLAWLQRNTEEFDRVEFQNLHTAAERDIRPDRVFGGLASLQGGADTTRGQEGTTPGAEGALSDAVARYRRPEARVRVGVQVARNRAATACMDLSDGLADAVTQIAEASGTGAEVDATAIPVHPAVPVMWPEATIHQALLGGDDYELLFAVSAKRRRAFLATARDGRGVPVTRIGRLTSPRDGLRLRRADGGEEPLPRGYEHFH